MRLMNPSMTCRMLPAEPVQRAESTPVDTVNYAETCGCIRAGADDSLYPR
jgi:hypothetical protein